jgi:hypothetical protein
VNETTVGWSDTPHPGDYELGRESAMREIAVEAEIVYAARAYVDARHRFLDSPSRAGARDRLDETWAALEAAVAAGERLL